MAKNIKTISLIDILPPNLSKDPGVLSAAKALDGELQGATAAIQQCLLLPRLGVLSEPVLDLLAWQWHVDFYEPLGLSIDKKRELIRKSIAWHRYKGTPAAVEEVVSAVYGNCTLTEWYEYGGEPYFFRVEVRLQEESTDKNRWKDILSAINSVKNTRSWMEWIKFYYPDIILPIIINHQAECTQIVDTHHIVWNLGEIKRAYWDGEFSANGSIRGNAIRPDANYHERQRHSVAMQMSTEVRHLQRRWYNIADGTVLADGSHFAYGSRQADLVEHAISFTAVKNNIESEAIPG